jgi:mannose-6-phosphate isomerase-like protein (cupin superfamily)
MFDLIEEAKKKKQGIVFRKYQIPTLTWEDMMKHIYKESIKWDDSVAKALEEKVKEVNNRDAVDSIGRVQIQNKLWLSPQQSNLFEEFPEMSELLYKLNKDVDNRKCPFYEDTTNTHDCDSDWHFQGIRMSLSNRVVHDHHDPHDIFYWQIVGTSFWKIDNDITHVLEPGDLLYLPLENSHEVWCDGPRAGLLIDNRNSIS